MSEIAKPSAARSAGLLRPAAGPASYWAAPPGVRHRSVVLVEHRRLSAAVAPWARTFYKSFDVDQPHMRRIEAQRRDHPHPLLHRLSMARPAPGRTWSGAVLVRARANLVTRHGGDHATRQRAGRRPGRLFHPTPPPLQSHLRGWLNIFTAWPTCPEPSAHSTYALTNATLPYHALALADRGLARRHRGAP